MGGNGYVANTQLADIQSATLNRGTRQTSECSDSGHDGQQAVLK